MRRLDRQPGEAAGEALAVEDEGVGRRDAAPSVTTARLTPAQPQRRQADEDAAPAPRTGRRAISENGKPMPQPWEMWPSMKPPIPASDIWASETWPT